MLQMLAIEFNLWTGRKPDLADPHAHYNFFMLS